MIQEKAMAETNKEMDAIYHLLEIEKNASSIVNEALKKREEKLAEVHSEYNRLYNERYAQVVKKLEEKYQAELQKKSSEYAEEIEKYRKELEERPQNDKDFFALLDKLLFV